MRVLHSAPQYAKTALLRCKSLSPNDNRQYKYSRTRHRRRMETIQPRQERYSLIAWAVLLVLKKPLVYLLLGELESAEALASVEYLSIITTLFICHGSLMIFRNTVQGMGFGASALASSVMEIIGRSAAGLLAVYFNSFFLICASAPMAWGLACICCIGLCAYYIPKKSREFAT